MALLFAFGVPDRLEQREVRTAARGASQRGILVIFQKRLVGLSEAALERFVRAARRAAGLKGAVNVFITSNAALRSLNHKFRGKKRPTDVLSFQASLSDSGQGSRLAGEIAISADMAVQNALRLGHDAAQEVKILTLHGILHLAGFDHERDNGEMARKEAELREKLGLPSGLIERADLSSNKAHVRKASKARLRSTA